MRPRASLALLMVATAAIASPGPLCARQSDGEPAYQAERRFVIPEHDLYPESVAHDPVTGDFFLGSMAHSRILRIAPDGSYRDFIAGTAPGLEGAIGMKVDADRRRLWVCSGRWVLFGGDVTRPPRTGVLLFDLDSGALLREWLVPQPSPGEIFNDLAVAPDGSVYATTTLMGRVYRVRAEAEELEPVFESEGLQTNGITLDDRGEQLFFSLHRGIARLDTRTGEVLNLEDPTGTVSGTDGLYFVSGALVSVQPGESRVLRLPLDAERERVTRADTLVADHPDLAYPTTGVVVGDSLILVATSFADRPRSPDRVEQHDDVVILSVPLVLRPGGPPRGPG